MMDVFQVRCWGCIVVLNVFAQVSAFSTNAELDATTSIEDAKFANATQGVEGSKSSDDNIDVGALTKFKDFALSVVLAGNSGVKATLPVFLLGVVHIAAPDSVPLQSGMEWVGHWYTTALLFILLVVEVLADHIPAVDHCLHAVLTPAHAIAGAVAAFAPAYYGGNVSHCIMALFGAGLASIFHAGKASFRATSTAHTGGFGTPVVSFAGTALAATTSVVSIFTWIFALIIALIMLVAAVFTVRGLRKGARRIRRLSTRQLGDQDEYLAAAPRTVSEASGQSLQPKPSAPP